jgi:hypothetical protein
MSAAVNNRPAQAESKSSKKKRAKGEATPTLLGPSATTSNGTPTPAEDAPNGAGEGPESTFMKELQKYVSPFLLSHYIYVEDLGQRPAL